MKSTVARCADAGLGVGDGLETKTPTWCADEAGPRDRERRKREAGWLGTGKREENGPSGWAKRKKEMGLG